MASGAEPKDIGEAMKAALAYKQKIWEKLPAATEEGLYRAVSASVKEACALARSINGFRLPAVPSEEDLLVADTPQRRAKLIRFLSLVYACVGDYAYEWEPDVAKDGSGRSAFTRRTVAMWQKLVAEPEA